MLQKEKGSHTFRNKTPLYPLLVLPAQLQCMAWLARNFIQSEVRIHATCSNLIFIVKQIWMWVGQRPTSLFSSFAMLLLMILFGEIGFFFKSDLFSCLFCSWWYGIQCFFHGAGCNSTSGIRGTMFILMYVVSYVGGANLLRHAEGATWLAIVTVKRLTLNWPSLRGINILERSWYWVLFCLVPRPQLRVADEFRVTWSERLFEATSPTWPTSIFVVYYALTTLHVHQFIFLKKMGLGQFFLTSVLL